MSANDKDTEKVEEQSFNDEEKELKQVTEDEKKENDKIDLNEENESEKSEINNKTADEEYKKDENIDNDEEEDKSETENNTSISEKVEEKKIQEKIEETENNPTNSIPQKKKRKDSKWIIVILIIFLAILFFSTIFSLLNMNKDTIIKGISIKGIDVSNLTIEEATNKVTEALNKELMLGIDLVYNEEYKVDFEPSQIEYSYDIYNAVKEAYNIGRTGNIVQNNYTILFSKFNGKKVDIKSSYNEDFMNNTVDDVGAKIPGLVVQASHYIEENQLVITRGQSGIIVKKEDLKNDILNSINNRRASEITDSTPKQIIQIKVENVEPDPIDASKISSEVYCEPQDAYYIPEPFQIFPEKEGVKFAISIEEAQTMIDSENKEEYIVPLILTPASKTIDDIGTEAFPYLISEFTTKYDASNINRSGNLKIAAEKINGRVLMPGEEFSFNEVVGKRTIEEGYRNAKIYENGQVVDGLAGGICQISSTLYNAVLLANLEVTERRNHSFTSTYVPAGRDATVVYGRSDLKFKNTRNYPIKLEANVANGIAEFKIHGIKEEVEYEIKILPVVTQSIPYQTIYNPDPALMPGQQVVTQYGHSGCRVTTYIEKRLGGVVASKDAITHDTYNAMSTIVNVGP